MNITESVYTALFCFIMIFGLLSSLYILLKISTAVIRFVEEIIKK